MINRKIRPTCNNCALEELQTGKCGNLLLKGEFKINPKAKELLMNTKLAGFCDYHSPAKRFEGKIDYSFAKQDVAVW